MIKATLQRLYLDDRTIGVFKLGDFECYTLELPDKDNQQNISCIQEGTYRCERIISPSLGDCYNIEGVQGRTYVRIHKGNYLHEIKGCILVGASLKSDMITTSGKTLNEMLEVAPDGFELTIM